MPIPDFDGNLVLPAHLGDPCDRSQISPYPSSPLELCQRFAISPERKRILDGLIRFRGILIHLGFRGFQWLDGSFLENVETRENRPPRDLDIITFFDFPSLDNLKSIRDLEPIIVDHSGIKNQYFLDHYLVDIAYNPRLTVEMTRYWTGLFSHRRDGIWKGMLKLELDPNQNDSDASEYLRSVK